MSDRERVAAANEAVSREVNEQIETLERGMAEVSDGNMHIVCECADLSCTQRLTIPIAKYEALRGDPTLFFVKQGHEKHALEVVADQEANYSTANKSPARPTREPPTPIPTGRQPGNERSAAGLDRVLFQIRNTSAKFALDRPGSSSTPPKRSRVITACSPTVGVQILFVQPARSLRPRRIKPCGRRRRRSPEVAARNSRWLR
jgi:hypothetical protein